MKNRIIKFNSLIILIIAISFILTSRLFAQGGTKFQGEIMCEVEGLSGAEEWEVIADCKSTLWGDGNYYITFDYTYVKIEGTGNAESDYGFNSPDDPNGQTDLAYG